MGAPASRMVFSYKNHYPRCQEHFLTPSAHRHTHRFGGLGLSFAETPAHFDGFDDRYEPPAAAPHDEDVAHYGPGYRPLCGEEPELAVHTDDPAQVAGYEDCL